MVNYKDIATVFIEKLCFSKFKSPNFRILGADINGYEPIRCFGDVSRRNFLFKYNATLYGDAFIWGCLLSERRLYFTLLNLFFPDLEG